MYHTLKSLFLILLSSLMFLACQEPGAANNAQKISLLYNQHAYFEEGPKLALLAPEIDLFVLLDEQGKEVFRDRKSTRLNSSHVRISYAVFCLKKKTINE